METPNDTVAYLGPQGTFSQIALEQLKQQEQLSVSEIETESVPKALDAVKNKQAKYALLPFENSIAGSVDETLKGLIYEDIYQIYSEITLPVKFTLAVKNPQFDDVVQVACVPIAWEQVKKEIKLNYPNAQPVATLSNAVAAEAVAREQYTHCITTSLAAKQRNLISLRDNLSDVENPNTRFVLIGLKNKVFPKAKNNKSAIVFELLNTSGSLVKALMEFSIRNINLARLEARPTQKNLGSYLFLTEIYGHIRDIEILEALKALFRKTENVNFLGSWPYHSSADNVSRLEKLPTDEDAQKWIDRYLDN